jgi:hypothetical protein
MGMFGAQLSVAGGVGAERSPSTMYESPTGTTNRLAKIAVTIFHLLFISLVLSLKLTVSPEGKRG